MQTMPPMARKYQEYVNGILQAAETKPDTLTSDEKRIAARHKKEMTRLMNLNGEISQIRDQMRQGEARLRSLELQAADTQGKVSGLLEYMISLKFPEVEDAVTEPTVN
jgi:hypothetical protein